MFKLLIASTTLAVGNFILNSLSMLSYTERQWIELYYKACAKLHHHALFTLLIQVYFSCNQSISDTSCFFCTISLELVQLASSVLLISTTSFEQVRESSTRHSNTCEYMYSINSCFKSHKFVGRKWAKISLQPSLSRRRSYPILLLVINFISFTFTSCATLHCCCCKAKLLLQLQCVALFFQKLVSLHSIFHETEQRAVFRGRFVLDTPTFVSLRLTIRNYHWARLRWKDVVLTWIGFPFRSQPNAYCLAVWNFSPYISPVGS